MEKKYENINYWNCSKWKTTLAKRLSRELNIMHYEIDRVVEQLDKYSSQLIRVNKIKYGEKYIKNEVTILIKRGNI